MLARTILSLLVSPLYGLLALFAAVPMFLVGTIVIGLLGSTLDFDPIGDNPSAFVTLGLWIFALFILSVALQIAYTVQVARYAGSFTKLQPIVEQPAYMTAFWRGVLIVIVMNAFFIMLVFLIGAFATDLWSTLGFNSFSQEELVKGMERLSEALAQNTRTAEVVALERVMFVMLAFNWLYTVTIGIILVPRACGVGGEAGLAWNGGYLLLRYVLVLPVCALFCAILAEGIVLVLEAALGDFQFIVRTQVSFSIQSFFFLGVAFGMEALMLKAAVDTVVKLYDTAQEAQAAGGGDDFREIRMRRMGG